ncbi:amidohydrolase [Natranaerobius thermophilus]|uniref:Amidohydrolase 3 n=1 Tax=Natranaerobius thermophilus (strain ATCC BAA-1301 / DSM 18059 / JW/NM-WN-LF) TaxID=457570 RepID=B2A6H2_NATTJ|nr:amidohydrolase [Natranaerobius thermophilus]ACB85505.1 Amidohydrolase 3 [Natranaerobius thermophilus JW/NM-WN-LF]
MHNHDFTGTSPHLILINGKIATVDSNNSIAEAIGIFGNLISHVGTTQELLKTTGPNTKVIDLQGKTVIPGIVDSHNHVYQAGILMEGVMAFGLESIKELQEAVKAKVSETPKGKWIRGGGWIESQFAENRMPNRWDLDEVAPDHPVVLSRLFAMDLCNSKALELAGINKNTPQPQRGTIDKDPKTGEPTGILRNGAQALVSRLIKDDYNSNYNFQELVERRVKTAMNEYLQYGITTVLDPGVSVPVMRGYQNLYKKGELPIRLQMMPEAYGLAAISSNKSDPNETEKFMDYLGINDPFGNEWFSIGPLKFAVDGGVGSKTALMYEPWIDGTKSNIPLRLDFEEMEKLFHKAQELGWSIGIHTCGDKAQDIVLEAFKKVIDRYPRNDVRHNIIHGYFPTDRALEIMKEYNIAGSLQPGFMYVEGDLYWDVLNQEQIEYFTPIKTYLNNKITVACNSDMISAHYNPFYGMYSAVARKTSQGKSLGAREKISREEMLRLFTINSAYLTFEENTKGSIEAGKLADIAVLSHDLLTCPESDILKTDVNMTIIDGKIVHSNIN